MMKLRGLGVVGIAAFVFFGGRVEAQPDDVWQRFRDQVQVRLTVPTPQPNTVELGKVAVEPIAKQHLPGWGQTATMRSNAQRLHQRIANVDPNAGKITRRREIASSLMLLLIAESYPNGALQTPLEIQFGPEQLELGQRTIEAWRAILELDPTDLTHHYHACSHFLCGRMLIWRGRDGRLPTGSKIREAIAHFDEALRTWKHLDRINPLESPFASAIEKQLTLLLSCHRMLEDYQAMVELIEWHEDWIVTHARQLDRELQYHKLMRHYARLGRLQYHVGDHKSAANSLMQAFEACHQRYSLVPPLVPTEQRRARQLLKLANQAVLLSERFAAVSVLEACEPIVEKSSKQRDLQLSFAKLLTQVAIRCADVGDDASATRYLSRATNLKRDWIPESVEGETELFSVAQDVPDSPLSTATLLRDYMALAECLEQVGQSDVALTELARAVELWEDLFRRDPWLRKTASLRLGKLKSLRPKEAVRSYRVTVALKRELSPLPPVVNNYRRLAADVYQQYAILLMRSGTEKKRELAEDAALSSAALRNFDEVALRRLVAVKQRCRADDAKAWASVLPPR